MHSRLTWLFALFVSSPALASPLLESHVGGMAFVGPTSAHVSAVFWNPACAALLKGTHFLLDGAAHLDYTNVERSTISTADGEPSAAGDKAFDPQSSLALTPTAFVGVVTDLGSDRITMGLAAYQAYAENLPDGDATVGYHASGGSFTADVITVSTSFRFNGTLSIGFGLNFVVTNIDLRFLYDSALARCGTAPCGVENPAAAASYHVATGWGLDSIVSFNFGFILHVNDWWIGGAMTSPPSASVFGTSEIQRDASLEVTQPGGGKPLTGEGRLAFRMPLTANLGVRHRLFGDYDLVVNGRFMNYSVHQVLDLRFFGPVVASAGIPEWMKRYRGFSDVYSLEAGVENQPGQALRLGARLRFESSAVPSSAVAVDQVDAPKLELSAGVEVRLGRKVAIVAGYALGLMLPIDATQSVFSPQSQITCVASSYDLDACAAARDGRALPTAAGTYTRVANQFNLGLAIDLW